jgi:hypothetical protein
MQLVWILKVCKICLIILFFVLFLLTMYYNIAGESGEISFVSSWKDQEIMYHVAPLMPSRDHDIQQVHRKRYIGNGLYLMLILFILHISDRQYRYCMYCIYGRKKSEI